MTDDRPLRAAFRRGDSESVRQVASQQVADARRSDDAAAEVEGLYALARVALREGDLDAARSTADAALARAQETEQLALTERPLHVLAAVARLSGDHLGARGLYESSIDLNTSLGNHINVHTESHNLAMTELHLGDGDRARTLMVENQDRVRRGGLDDFVPYLGLAGAALALFDDDVRRAAAMLGFTVRAFAALDQVPDPDDQRELDDLRERVRMSIGDDALETELARGASWTLSDAFGGVWPNAGATGGQR